MTASADAYGMFLYSVSQGVPRSSLAEFRLCFFTFAKCRFNGSKSFSQVKLIIGFLICPNVLKPLHDLAVKLNGVVPHGKRTHPCSMLTVKSLVNHHIFKRFAVFGKADDHVLITFIVAVYPERDWGGTNWRHNISSTITDVLSACFLTGIVEAMHWTNLFKCPTQIIFISHSMHMARDL